VQTWTKRGQVCDGTWELDWAVSHAALPVVEAVEGTRCRVLFSARDTRGRSSIAAGAFDLEDPSRGFTIDPAPLLQPGALGSFDDNGVTTSCLIAHEGRKYQYYTGWTLGVTVPFYFYVGLAISDDDGRTYRRASTAPILDRTAIDPYLTASPSVLIENGVWRMWYVSAVAWVPSAAGPKHYYHVKYAESGDGVQWRRHGRVCIDFTSSGEYAISRPCVVHDGDGVYRMWYAYRGNEYRIGYAESRDGLVWDRQDARAGIGVSAAGWDSGMVEYPCVFDASGARYMLYNGNGYGRTGMGLAVLTAPESPETCP
jgi:hypothetical protein